MRNLTRELRNLRLRTALIASLGMIAAFGIGYSVGIDMVKPLQVNEIHWFCTNGVCEQVGPDPQGHLAQGDEPKGLRCPGGREIWLNDIHSLPWFEGCAQ